MLYFGAKLVIDGSLTVGELVAFNILAGRVSAPVLRLAQIWQDFHQARLSVKRLGDILNAIPEPSYTPGQTAMPAIRGDVAFEHVTFRYRIDGLLQEVPVPAQIKRFQPAIVSRIKILSNLDIADTHAKLGTYARAGLLSGGSQSLLPQLGGKADLAE